MPTSRLLNKFPQKSTKLICAFCGFNFVSFACGLNGSSTGHLVDNQHDHSHHEQQMDKTAADV
jgi:hypothetical protein